MKYMRWSWREYCATPLSVRDAVIEDMNARSKGRPDGPKAEDSIVRPGARTRRG